MVDLPEIAVSWGYAYFGCIPAFAQAESEQPTESGVILESNSLWQNWFVSGGIGTSVFFGDADSYGAFSERFAPALDLSVGKWITPYMALRLQYSGLQLKGHVMDGNSVYAYGDINSDNHYQEKWNYMHFHGDVMLNLSNAICGYKEDRFYSLIPYAGIGWARAPKCNEDAMTANLGIHNSFRVNSALDLNFDVRGTILGDDNFDHQIGGDYGADGILTATVGVTYKFGKRGWKKYKPTKAITQSTVYTQPTNNDSQLRQLKAENTQLKSDVQSLKNTKAAVPAVVTETMVASNVVFFELNETKLTEKNRAVLGLVAKAINSATSSKVYTIVGYADNATGNKENNLKLSKARAEAVYNALVGEFNVDKSKLKMSYKGGVDNMFYDNSALSRAVIME